MLFELLEALCVIGLRGEAWHTLLLLLLLSLPLGESDGPGGRAGQGCGGLQPNGRRSRSLAGCSLWE